MDLGTLTIDALTTNYLRLVLRDVYPHIIPMRH